MPRLINYTHCPACGSDQVKKKLAAKDHTVSGEIFEIWYCVSCTNGFTQSIPVAEEIGPYYQSAAYVSHSDTEKGLINRLYHLVRNYTLTGKRNLLQKTTGKREGFLLDVGAGTGAFSHTMQQAGWQVTALEPDATARENAKRRYGLQPMPAETLYQLPENSFDAITLWHVLEHVHDLQGYLDCFRKLLKRGGKLVIAVPNYTSYDAGKYGEYWAAWDVPRHLYHFSPAGMKQVGNRHGFELVNIHPMWFDSFYVAMLSEQYRKGNIVRAFWHGLLSNLIAMTDHSRCSSVIYVFVKP